MANLSREQILAAEDLKRTSIDVPEWGGSVLVRPMTARERIKFLDLVNDSKGDTEVWLVVTACINEDGSPKFKPEDADVLLQKHWRAIQGISRGILRANGLVADAAEEAAKN